MHGDLTFVRHRLHRHLFEKILAQAVGDDEVTGVILLGSVARGDAHPGSDLDVQMLLCDGCSRKWQPETRHGILVECSYADFDRAASKLRSNPMRVYAYLDGRILHDPEGRLEQLVDLARFYYKTYRVSLEERKRISYWLKSTRVKMLAAKDAGDELKAAYNATVSSWKILEGIWASNERPVPSSGAVWAHVKDLTTGPPSVEAHLRDLFVGDTHGRIQAAVDLIKWIVPVLDRPGSGAVVPGGTEGKRLPSQ